MCDICRHNPCHSQCPNAPEPDTVYTCEYCGTPIYVGDEYFEYEGNYYHYDECAAEVATSLLLRTCGATKGVAKSYDWGDYFDD